MKFVRYPALGRVRESIVERRDWDGVFFSRAFGSASECVEGRVDEIRVDEIRVRRVRVWSTTEKVQTASLRIWSLWGESKIVSFLRRASESKKKGRLFVDGRSVGRSVGRLVCGKSGRGSNRIFGWCAKLSSVGRSVGRRCGVSFFERDLREERESER